MIPISIVEAAETPEQRMEKLERQMTNQEQLLEGYQKLLEESKNFREDLQQQTQLLQTNVQIQLDSLYQTVSVLLTIFTIVLGGLQVYFIYSLGQSRKEVKETIQEMKKETREKIREQQEKLEEEQAKDMKKIQEEIDQQFKEQLYRVLNEDKSVEAIQQIVQKELSYTSARICVVSLTKQGKNRLQDREIPLIKQAGIKEDIMVYTFEQNKEQIQKKIEDGEIDVLIYYCEPLEEKEKKDQSLFELVEMVKDSKRDIPLITYTYEGRDKLEDDDKNKANELIHTPANFPSTLLQALLSLAYVFNHKTSQQKQSLLNRE